MSRVAPVTPPNSSRQPIRLARVLAVLLLAGTVAGLGAVSSRLGVNQLAAAWGSAASAMVLVLVFLLGAAVVLLACAWGGRQQRLTERLATATKHAQNAIAEREAAEKKARENEERLRFALASCGIGAWDIDLIDQTAYRSPEHDRIFGYEQPLSSWTLKDFLAHALPCYREPIRRMVETATAARTGWTYECEIRRADGAMRWIWFTGRLYTDSRGHDRVVGVVQDITARKQAEAALRQSEARFRALIEASAEVVYHMNADWTQMRFLASQGFLDATAAPIEDWQSKYILAADQPQVAAAIQQAIDTKQPFQLEHRVKRADGSVGWTASRAVPLVDANGAITDWFGMASDITARKQAEEAVRASEAKFRALFERAAIGIGRVRFSDARWIDVNEAFCGMVGYSAAELKDTPWPRITHPEDLERDWVPFRRMAAGELDRYSVEKRFLHKDGHPVWARLTLSLVRDAAGRPDYEIAVIEDITERKQTEQQLRQALTQAEQGQRLLNSLLEHLPMGITIADAPDVTIRAVSRYGQQLTGKPPEQIQGIPVDLHAQRWQIYRSDGVTPASNEELPLTRATQHGEIVREEEFVLRRSDGVSVPILCTAAPIRDPHGQITGGVIGWQDITARKQAELALHQTEERLRLATEATGIGIFDYNLLSGQLLWLENARRHFGLGPDTPVDYGVFLRGLHPEDRDRVDRLTQDTLGGANQGYYHTEYRTIGLEDGHLRWLDARGQVLFDNQGRPVRFVGVTLDISERKHLENKLRRFAATLEQRVAERTAELMAAVKELEGFTYTVAHDLRAPLRHVHGFAEILARSAAEHLNQTERDNIGRIRAAAERMQHLVDGLLEFAQLGRTSLARAPVALGPLVAGVREQLQPEAEGRQVQWRIGALPWVTGDERLLRQVFFNLLDNALKFTRPRTPAVIEIGQAQPSSDGQTVVYVRDNGVGFDMQYAGKLFGVFQRLHDRREFEGTGIGLAHVQRIIQRHGGQVWAESALEAGTTIYLSLPAAE